MKLLRVNTDLLFPLTNDRSNLELEVHYLIHTLIVHTSPLEKMVPVGLVLQSLIRYKNLLTIFFYTSPLFICTVHNSLNVHAANNRYQIHMVGR